jgi:Flp pilus assembly secretin CpaC
MHLLAILWAAVLFGAHAPEEVTIKAAQAGGPPSTCKDEQPRCFLLACTVYQTGENGTRKILAQPNLVTRDGQEASFLSGGQRPVPGPESQSIEFVDFGLSFRVKVNTMPEDQVRLDASVEVKELKPDPKERIRVSGRSVRTIEVVKLGKVVRLSLDPKGGRETFLEIKIEPISQDKQAAD